MGEAWQVLILALGIVFLAAVIYLSKKRETMKEPKFEMFNDEAGKIRFRLKAPNGEIICQSEAYETKQACVDTINVLPEYAKKATLVDLTKKP